MVLEWLEGSTLEHILDEARNRGMRPYTLENVLPLLSQVAHALDIAHQRGIAHRDVKPANLFLLAPGYSVVKLLDFGVAKMVTDNTQIQAAMARTGMGITSFTPQYGAPEQFHRKFGATGPWTDVFALALVLVEVVSGQTALAGTDTTQLYIVSTDATHRPTLRGVGVDTSDEVEAVLKRALCVEVRDRYHTAGAFWDALVAALPSPVRAANRASWEARQGGAPGAKEYVQMVQTRYNLRIVAACTAVSTTDLAPHYQAGQLLGLAGGMSATAEYEIMVAELVGLDPRDGLGAKALDVLNIGHLVIIAAIVFGNVIFFLGRRRARGAA
jgi:hypothetical protein